MNSNFPRLLSLLRKERGISQKNAAKELGVSQALLSHYEKGIRECGLSFVVRAADFYDVSCDYLLGRSPERKGTTLSAEDLHDPYNQKEMPNPKTLKAVYNKKLLFCSLNILFDILSKAGSSNMMNEISNFLCLSVYRMFRVVFRINKKNQDEMFVVADPIANQRAQAEMIRAESTADVISRATLPKIYGEPKNPEQAHINNELLEKNYPNDKSALLNLIKNCEILITKSK